MRKHLIRLNTLIRIQKPTLKVETGKNKSTGKVYDRKNKSIRFNENDGNLEDYLKVIKLKKNIEIPHKASFNR